MHHVPHAAFWQADLSQTERTIIYYFLVVAAAALLASFVRTWTTRGEIGPRYRPAAIASLAVTGVAFLSYVVIVIKFDLGYTPIGDGTWAPNEHAIWSWASRYMDWSITVPLLMVELIAVSALAGAQALRVRTVAMGAAFAMIFTGYLGGVVIGDGESLAALWTWGLISTAFMVVLYVVLIGLLVRTPPLLSAEAGRLFRLAILLQLVIFFSYPIVYGVQGYAPQTGGWTAFAQITLSIADVIAKVGFGAIIHSLAKVRTAEDLAGGLDTHPESAWLSNEKRADAALPPVRDEHPRSRRAVSPPNGE